MKYIVKVKQEYGEVGFAFDTISQAVSFIGTNFSRASDFRTSNFETYVFESEKEKREKYMKELNDALDQVIKEAEGEESLEEEVWYGDTV